MTEQIIQIIKNAERKRHENHVNAGKNIKEKWIKQSIQKAIDDILLLIDDCRKGLLTNQQADILHVKICKLNPKKMNFEKSIIYGKCPCCKEWTYIIGVGCEKCQKLKFKIKEQ